MGDDRGSKCRELPNLKRVERYIELDKMIDMRVKGILYQLTIENLSLLPLSD